MKKGRAIRQGSQYIDEYTSVFGIIVKEKYTVKGKGIRLLKTLNF